MIYIRKKLIYIPKKLETMITCIIFYMTKKVSVNELTIHCPI